MKKLLLFVLLFISVVANAQKGISYQAVILDPSKIEIPGQDISGQPYVNGNVNVKFVILSGTTSQFEEVQQTKTDAYGLVNLTIGSSASTAFNALTWDANQKSLQVFVSFNNGASYTKVSDQKLTYSPYALFSETAGKLGSTLEIANGGTGATTAVGARANLGLGNVDNTSDAAKPISTATQAALNLKANVADVNAALALKATVAALEAHMAITADTTMLATKAALTDLNNYAPKASPTFTGTVSGIDKTMVGLGSVDNTSDAAKPISTATQAALDLKANEFNVSASLASKAPLISPSLTGVPTAPTASPGTNSTQIATTAFTSAAIAAATAGISSGVADNSVTSVKIVNGAVTDAKISSVSGSKITGVIPVANGGTGQTTVSGILSTLGFASNNIAIGSQAGTPNQGGNANTIAIGGGAGRGNQGQSSIAIGYVSGDQNQGANSISIGGNAAQGSQGTQAVAIGFAAGQNGQGANSVAIGTFAGQSGQAANSIAINATGTSTPLNPATTGFFVDPIRNASATSNALYYNTTTREITSGSAASGVSSIGSISGSSTAKGASITSGVLNLAPADATNGGIVTTGNQAFSGGKVFNENIQVNSVRIGAPGSAGSQNTMVGAFSFQYGAPGGNNTGVGTMSLASITNTDNGGTPGGNDNTAVGSNAIRQGQGASNGNRNTAVGSTALTNASDASDNTALGYATLPIATGGANTAVGSNSLAAITSGTNNTAIGYGATVSSGTQTNSTAIGNGAIVTASNTIQLGNTSVTNVKTSGTVTAGAITYPSVHGSNGQVLSTTGSGTLTWTTLSGGVPYTGATGAVNLGAYDLTVNGINIGKGLGAIPTNTSIGNAALPANTTGARNTAAGNQALQYNTTGSANTAFGYQALQANTTGGSNVAVGNGALYQSNAFHNVGIGESALAFNYSGSYNIGIGRGTMTGNKYGSSNIAIGSEAGYNLNNYNYNSGNGGGNVFIGHQAARGPNLGATNTAIGYWALNNNLPASSPYTYNNNVALGAFAGTSTLADNNTFLGVNSNVDNSSWTNATAIGYNAIVTASNTIQLGNASVTNVKTSGKITAGAVTYPSVHGSNGQVLSTTGSGTLTWTTPTSVTVGTISNTSNANGATITAGGVLNLAPADATNGGIVTNGAQTFRGDKEIAGNLKVSQILGAETLDQSSTTGYAGTGAYSSVWQSFTAGTSGVLSKVSMDFYDCQATGTLYIYQGTGTNGTVLTSQSFSISTIGAEIFQDFTLINPVNVLSGSVYTIAFIASTGTLWEGMGGPNSYTRGAAYYGDSPSSNSITSWSILFKTFVKQSSGGEILTDGKVSGGNTASSTISGFSANMNTQTGTSYTLLASDNGKIITLNNASAITLTVPALFTGFNCMIVQLGAGEVTLTPSGTTISNRSSYTKTAGTNAIVSLIGLSGTTFISAGDMR